MKKEMRENTDDYLRAYISLIHLFACLFNGEYIIKNRSIAARIKYLGRKRIPRKNSAQSSGAPLFYQQSNALSIKQTLAAKLSF